VIPSVWWKASISAGCEGCFGGKVIDPLIDRPLATTTPSIAPSTINDIKTIEFPWFFAPKGVLVLP
jgi:hypothetical protein